MNKSSSHDLNYFFSSSIMNLEFLTISWGWGMCIIETSAHIPTLIVELFSKYLVINLQGCELIKNTLLKIVAFLLWENELLYNKCINRFHLYIILNWTKLTTFDVDWFIYWIEWIWNEIKEKYCIGWNTDNKFM